jgi:DNA-directed RNA polymerase specialized sigma subunit
MCFFDKNDLRAWILDEEIFSLFKLLEREKQILHMHLVKGFTFEFIGGILRISRQRVHQLYANGVTKIKNQTADMLREYKQLAAGSKS